MAEHHPINILLVDDKKENLLSLQVILAGEGYHFAEASSGKEALRILLKRQDFAIILMDVQMPLMDGFETAEMIRQSDRLKHVPIIFLTANMNAEEFIFKGYQAGAVDYMVKPLSAEILKAKVMVFAELYRKNRELVTSKEELKVLNTRITVANKELAKQYAEIERHLNELKIANKELEAFNYISSHDLQEPLRKIQTFISIIEEKEKVNLSENGRQYFGKIIGAANRMRQLIESLLEFSRTTLKEREYEWIDLDAVIAELKDDFQEILKEKNAVIEADALGRANVIAFQFRQLLENLVGNSLKFAKPDVQLKVKISSRTGSGAVLAVDRLRPECEYCHIAIEDNGIGFEPNASERIFEVFQKVHHRDMYEGSGIGLAIVKKIVENHNGHIVASGAVMKGAKFDIYLPN
jgi:signal transduction histidine kinase